MEIVEQDNIPPEWLEEFEAAVHRPLEVRRAILSFIPTSRCWMMQPIVLLIRWKIIVAGVKQTCLIG